VIICLYAGLAVTLAMVVSWVVQRAANNAGWVDVFWTFSTGVALAAVALAAPGVLWRHILLAILVLIWAARLGGYVALRVATGPEDTRYILMRESAGRNFQKQMAWLIAGQGPVSGLLAISVYLAATQPDPALRWTDIAGVLILTSAMVGEGLADAQLRAWRARPGHQGGICEDGLWAFCRHPNYLFEALLWLAFPVMALSAAPVTWLSFIAPVMMFLVLRFLTGVPPLEAAMLARRGAAYRAYQARTSAMWPRFKRNVPEPPQPPKTRPF
jgi:steroid 5-alpha reductase family enzyme